MTKEKFMSEVNTLKRFFEIYCINKHSNQTHYHKQLDYNDEKVDTELRLCPDCIKLIYYSFDRLCECPHDPKPRCRTCSNPCYNKNEWKKVAKIMRYSGMKLGLLKIKKIFTLKK